MWLVYIEHTDAFKYDTLEKEASKDLPNFLASLWTVCALKRELYTI